MKTEAKIKIDGVTLYGALTVPENPIGIVVFAHGSGSGRFSPRNNFVAEVLNKQGIATLLPDLLTEEEDSVYENRFDIDLLTERLAKISDWLRNQAEIKDLPVGLFGASTGAAAALSLAADLGEKVAAIVSRGGRPDLAMDKLGKVSSPTLLVVGGEDREVIGLNNKALEELRCEKRLEIIPNATHLFEEPGTLEEVAQLAVSWFKQFFVPPADTEENIPPRYRNESENPSRPHGKVRGRERENYWHFHRK